jgi:hypothetical protein
MIYRCMKEGLTLMGRQRRLSLLLWLWTLLLALMATIPLSQWWKNALGNAPEADRLLEGFSSQILKEVSIYDQNSLWQLVTSINGLLLLFALLASSFVAGGTLGLIAGTGNGPTMAQFMSGAGRYFWRFLRLMVLGGIVAGLVLGLIAMATSPLVSRFSDAGWERTSLLGGMIQAALLMALAACFTVVLDYARIRMVVEPSNRAVRSFFSAVGFVFFRAPGALVLAAFFGILSTAVWLICFGLSTSVPAKTGLTILFIAAIQQLLLLVRCALRVGVLGAHTAYFIGKSQSRQAPAEVLPPVPPPVTEEDEPSSEVSTVEEIAKQDENTPSDQNPPKEVF